LTRFPQQQPQLRTVLATFDEKRAAELAPGAAGAALARPVAAAAVAPANVPSHEDLGPPRSAAELVDHLGRIPLASPAQRAALSRQMGTGAADPRSLSQDLLRRGWLTPYQINQLMLGRGRELVLGPYELLERLGEGGVGQVFKARHQKLNRSVALKLVRKELLADAEVVGRFYREIQILSQLNHPNIVRAYDA